MLRESGPLMLNNLLVTVLWRISQFALPYFVGAAALGLYSPGVAWLDGLNVIPAYFTAAIFPLMSRYARSGTDSLVKAYRLAVQLLLITALPLAVFFTFAATVLINIQSGAAYLPGAAIALRIMIWSIPIGFVNSVTQYALIAVGQQRFLTRAFVIGVAFTAAANLIFVPKYGYLAAAAILVAGRALALHPVHMGRPPLCRADELGVDRGTAPAGRGGQRRRRPRLEPGRRAAVRRPGGRLSGLLRRAAHPRHVPRRRLRGDPSARAETAGRR